MKIEVKYNIGDNIRYIQRTPHAVYVECPCCGGEGWIFGADKKIYDCPNCEGFGKICEKEIESEEEKTGTIKTFAVSYNSEMECYHGKPWIYYTTPQSLYRIMQDDIIEKIYSEEEQMAYSE